MTVLLVAAIVYVLIGLGVYLEGSAPGVRTWRCVVVGVLWLPLMLISVGEHISRRF